MSLSQARRCPYSLYTISFSWYIIRTHGFEALRKSIACIQIWMVWTHSRQIYQRKPSFRFENWTPILILSTLKNGVENIASEEGLKGSRLPSLKHHTDTKSIYVKKVYFCKWDASFCKKRFDTISDQFIHSVFKKKAYAGTSFCLLKTMAYESNFDLCNIKPGDMGEGS